MPSDLLNGRKWKVRIGGVKTEDLDVSFQITKTLTRAPNTCSLQVFNLSEDNRGELEKLNIYDTRGSGTNRTGRKSAKAGNIPVEIVAGYEDATSLLFRGFLRTALSVREDSSWRTEVEGEDGGREFYASRVSLSFPPGTPKLNVVRTCAAAMGVGLGNVEQVTALLLKKTFSDGTVLDGQAADELRRILRKEKIRYSVQNGNLQFTENGKGTTEVLAMPLSNDTGVVGSPSRDATGAVLVRTLLIPRVSPGIYVTLTQNRYEGLYQVAEVTHSGSTFGLDWYHDLTLLPA